MEDKLDEMSDEVLVMKWQNGNLPSAEVIAQRYTPQIYKICFRLLNNTQDAEDAVQNTFTNVCENIKGLREVKYFRGWITKIATNVCLAMLKKSGREKPIGEIELEDESSNYEDVFIKDAQTKLISDVIN